MGFGVPGAAALTASVESPRRSPRGLRTSPELRKAYKGIGGPRIADPHHPSAARRVDFSMRVVSAVGLDPMIGVGGGGWDNRNRKRDGRLEATAAVAKAARAVGIAPKNAMRTVRRTLQHIRKGARVEESAPPPGARQPGSGRKELLKPWMLELATKQAKKWRGYFSLDDMWEFLRQRCMDEGWDLDFSRRNTAAPWGVPCSATAGTSSGSASNRT